jgi:hypothetical protein
MAHGRVLAQEPISEKEVIGLVADPDSPEGLGPERQSLPKASSQCHNRRLHRSRWSGTSDPWLDRSRSGAPSFTPHILGGSMTATTRGPSTWKATGDGALLGQQKTGILAREPGS